MAVAARKRTVWFPARGGLPGNRQEAEKLGYFRAPAWGLIVGTGVYPDDIEAEIRRRREAMAASQAPPARVRLARTGYVLVMRRPIRPRCVPPYARTEGTSAASSSVPGT